MVESSKWPRYKETVESGVDVIGRIPSHWKIVPVRRLATLVNGYPFPSELFHPTEGFPLLRIRDLNKESSESRYGGPWVDHVKVTKQDLLIGMDGDFNVGRWLGDEAALLNQRLCMLRGSDEAIRLLEYAFPSHLRKVCTTSAVLA